MWLLNTTKIGNKTYTAQDIVNLYPPKQMGFEEDFYGGRVNWVSPAKNNEHIILLIEYRDGVQNVIDLAVKNVTELPIYTLRSLAAKQNFSKEEFGRSTTKEELLKLFGA